MVDVSEAGAYAPEKPGGPGKRVLRLFGELAYALRASSAGDITSLRSLAVDTEHFDPLPPYTPTGGAHQETVSAAEAPWGQDILPQNKGSKAT